MGSARPRSAAGIARKLLVLAVLSSAGLVAGARGASAHALLRASTPEDGSQLTEAPGEVVLSFTEEPEPSLSDVQVLDGAGAVVSTKPAAPAPANALTVPVEDLPEGVYTVTWRVVSRVDGHATAGAVAFGIGVPAEVGPSGQERVEEPPTSPVEIAGRWAMFAGLGLLLGGAWVAALAFAAPPRRLLRGLLVAWGVSVAGLLALAIGQWRAAGVGLGQLLGTGIGGALVWRAGGIAVAGIGLVVALPGRSRGALAVSGLAAAAALLAHVAAGHAGAGELPVLEIGAQWVHVVAVGVWLGGLAALLLGIRGRGTPDRSRAVRRFSAVALVTFVVVAGTGVVRALNEIPSWNALFSTLYGRLVLVKLGLILVLGALGAANRFRHVRRADRDVTGLRRASRGELVLGAAALAAAAVMASVAPPAPAALSPGGRPGVVVRASDFARTVAIRLEARPGMAGSNRFVVRLTDPDTQGPLTADRLALRFSYLGGQDVGSSTLELDPQGGGTFAAMGTNLSLPGRWEITVLLQRGAGSTEVPIELGTLCGAKPIPGGAEPTIYRITLPGGSAQGYVDPGAPGSNEVHITYFDSEGTEMPVQDDVTMTASGAGDTISLESRRLGPGHFVAGADLAPGRWRFDITAADPTGRPLPACFEETIG